MPRRNDPDRILCAKLTGIAGRHAQSRTSDAEAVDELRSVARGRTDLLAHVAGTELGAAHHNAWPERSRRAAELCILAGADQTLIPAIEAEVRERLTRPLHQTHD